MIMMMMMVMMSDDDAVYMHMNWPAQMRWQPDTRPWLLNPAARCRCRVCPGHFLWHRCLNTPTANYLLITSRSHTRVHCFQNIRFNKRTHPNEHRNGYWP